MSHGVCIRNGHILKAHFRQLQVASARLVFGFGLKYKDQNKPVFSVLQCLV